MTDDIQFNVLPGRKGDIGEIRLNRPKALNALSLDMCVALREQLLQWQQDATIKAVIIAGEGGRAFCAGGDVRALYQNRTHIAEIIDFFRQEYRMNKTIFHFTKPYISLLDGITMGGGAGVSIHGSHRVASEFFSFAMPETAIGFFPDIGAGYFLNQCPGKMGYYLGLTGVTIKISDAVALGLVNHFVERAKQPALVRALCEADFLGDPMKHVSAIIAQHHFEISATDLMPHAAHIECCFTASNVQAIIKNFQSLGNDWSKEIVALLSKRSPSSLAVTFQYLQRAATLNFDEVMQMNFNLAQAFMQRHDFFEGVRAVLMDKDQAPQWEPKSIEHLQEQEIERYFENAGPL
ncbi:MAG: 3-hydroxyisobutyryl-CoA hydrolase [Coxiella sp. RIFCSPHIGHO2_12_FULL_44_14]|nr:MAG: 3-hydroxyisobutyryl-CoA hydrolase [Coxiella sp. RIFCSPHIGHO2_12_FULL_44_14]